MRDPSPEVTKAILRRVVIAQGLYAIGLIAGLFHVEAGIALIILVQLNYAVAPKLPWLSKL